MIIQTNIWICEGPGCGHTESTTEMVFPYTDPVVTPPKEVNWSYEFMTIDDKELHLCNTCFDKYLELDKKDPGPPPRTGYFLDYFRSRWSERK